MQMTNQAHHTDTPATREADVLIVEDNRINSMVTRHIAQTAGFSADVAFSGTAALELLQAHRYGLVLLDVQLPDMSGIDVLRGIRDGSAGAGDPRIPVVALSAYGSEADRRACREAGADDFLEKPISREAFEDLAERIPGLPRPGHGGSRRGPASPPAAPPAAAPPAAAPRSERPILDRTELESRLTSRDLARTVASRFLDLLDESLAEISRAVASGDHRRIRSAAHALASPAANTGCDALHGVLRRMERAAVAEDRDTVEGCAADIDPIAGETRRALEDYLSSTAPR